MNIDEVRINTTNPCLILFLLDQSGSMNEKFGADSKINKADAVAMAVNETIHNIGLNCISDNGNIRDRFEISVMGYGTHKRVESAFGGALEGRWVVPISELINNPLEFNEHDGAPIWINPVAGFATPMKQAFENAYDLCTDWINYEGHINSHPPIIINITDGQATDSGYNDSDLIDICKSISNLKTNYGNLFTFNVHISSSKADQILFPNNMLNSNDNFAKLLFDISSDLTPKMITKAEKYGYPLSDTSRGFIFNGRSSDLIKFLNIGSDPA